MSRRKHRPRLRHGCLDLGGDLGPRKQQVEPDASAILRRQAPAQDPVNPDVGLRDVGRRDVARDTSLLGRKIADLATELRALDGTQDHDIRCSDELVDRVIPKRLRRLDVQRAPEAQSRGICLAGDPWLADGSGPQNSDQYDERCEADDEDASTADHGVHCGIS